MTESQDPQLAVDAAVQMVDAETGSGKDTLSDKELRDRAGEHLLALVASPSAEQVAVETAIRPEAPAQPPAPEAPQTPSA